MCAVPQAARVFTHALDREMTPAYGDVVSGWGISHFMVVGGPRVTLDQGVYSLRRCTDTSSAKSDCCPLADDLHPLRKARRTSMEARRKPPKMVRTHSPKWIGSKAGLRT